MPLFSLIGRDRSATAIIGLLNKSVFQGCGGDPLPSSFALYPTFVAHRYLAALLSGPIDLHVAASAHHQFVLKNALLRPMLFRSAMSTRPAPAECVARSALASSDFAALEARSVLRHAGSCARRPVRR
jgi:hypothetical protein